MKESEFVRLLLKNLKGVFHRNHGSEYGTAGLPDIEGCSEDGKSIVIECKIGKRTRKGISLRSPLTKLQAHWLQRYLKNGASAYVAVYLDSERRILFFLYESLGSSFRSVLAEEIQSFCLGHLLPDRFLMKFFE
jgi:hypothetical protein